MITYNIKLQFSSQQDKNQLQDILSRNKDIWNFISTQVYNLKTLNKKVIHDKVYYQSKLNFPGSQSQIIIRAERDVVSAYRSAFTNGATWDTIYEKEAFIKKRSSMRLDKRLYKMTQNYIELTTLTKYKRIKCQFMLYDKVKELFQTHTYGDPLVFERNGDFYLSVSFDTSEEKIEGTKAIGIDVGERRFITTSQGDCLAGKELGEYKRRKRYQKRILQRKKEENNSHSCRKKLKKNSKKDRNYTKNYIQHVTNEVLEIATKEEADIIVLEDLDGIKDKNKGKDSNRRRDQYPWREFRDILTYKALLNKKRVETVDPYNTSKDDYRDNYPQGVRKGCRYYASDGKVFDADWLGAINIGKRYSVQSKHPLSFSTPLDGGLNYRGRLSQEPIVDAAL